MPKKLRDDEFIYVHEPESDAVPYNINEKNTIPEDDYETWKDEVDSMTREELVRAKNHFSIRIFRLTKVLDLICGEMKSRERKNIKIMMPSRKGSEIAMRRSMSKMSQKRRAQMLTGMREHYRR